MVQGGDPRDLLKDPCAARWESGSAFLQFPPGCIFFFTPAALRYLLTCAPYSPTSSAFFLLTTSVCSPIMAPSHSPGTQT